MMYQESKGLPDTAQSFYVQHKEKDPCSYHSVVALLQRKTHQLKDCLIEKDALQAHLQDADQKISKLMISAEWMEEMHSLTEAKSKQLLCSKIDCVKQIRQLQQQISNNIESVKQCGMEIGMIKKQINAMRGTININGEKLQMYYEQCQMLDSHLSRVELIMRSAEMEVMKKREENKQSEINKCVLETMLQKFKCEIDRKQKQIRQQKNEQREINNNIVQVTHKIKAKHSEVFQVSHQMPNFSNANEKLKEINGKLQQDLACLLKHLQNVQKNNKRIQGCLEGYREVEVRVAKKILADKN